MGEAKRKAGIGEGPVEARHLEAMNRIAVNIDRVLNQDDKPRDFGFVLMVFPFGGGENRCNYISNAERADIIVMMKEQLRRFEGQPDIRGTA